MFKVGHINKDFFLKKQAMKVAAGGVLVVSLLGGSTKVNAIDYTYADLMTYYSLNLSETQIEVTYRDIVQLILGGNSGTTIYGFAKLEGQALKNYEEKFDDAMKNMELIYNIERPLGISWEKQTMLTANALVGVEALLNPNPIQKELFVRDYIVRYQLVNRIYSSLRLSKEHSMKRSLIGNNIYADNLINASKEDKKYLVYANLDGFVPINGETSFGEEQIRKILRP